MEKDLKARVKKAKEEDAIKLYGAPVKKKVKYSDAEKRAYYMGYGAGRAGAELGKNDAVDAMFLKESERGEGPMTSFLNGLFAAKKKRR